MKATENSTLYIYSSRKYIMNLKKYRKIRDLQGIWNIYLKVSEESEWLSKVLRENVHKLWLFKI